MRCMLFPLMLVGSLGIPSASADQWGHWRGVNGNGTSLEAEPPVEWSAEKNVKWKVRVPGKGSGSPIVWDDQVFVVTAVPVEVERAVTFTEPPQGPPQRRRRRRESMPIPKLQFKLLCYNRADGSLRWEQTAAEATPHEGTHSTNGFASASPCTDGKHVYAHFGSRGLYCYTMDGELVWKRNDLGKMTMRHGFGEGSSPTLAGDVIIVPWDHEEDSFIYALDRTTGATVWQTPREGPSCWATPLIVEDAEGAQVVMNGEDLACGYDLKTGKELWRCRGQTQRPVASAVADDGLIFVGSGHRGAYLGAFRLGARGDLAGTEEVVWTRERDTPDIASPLLSEGRLYFHKGKQGLLTCVDAATGEPHFEAKRLPELTNIYASPVAAGGHVYLSDRDGTTVVIKDAPQLEVVAVNSIGETIDATPAPVGDELFIRGEEHLFCIAE
ncbi:MAG: PQQ-binding-like beta-propeller repeat protein [Planctomycetota bacterium]